MSKPKNCAKYCFRCGILDCRIRKKLLNFDLDEEKEAEEQELEQLEEAEG